MEVQILKGTTPSVGFRPVHRLWVSPDGKWAAAEVYRGELLVAGRVRSRSEDRLTLEWLSEVSVPADGTELWSFGVEWSWLRYGFFKLICRGLEFGERHVRRCYTDPALYERQRKKLHPDEKQQKSTPVS